MTSIPILADAARQWAADVVVVVGLDVLPYLVSVRKSIYIQTTRQKSKKSPLKIEPFARLVR